MHYPRFSRLIGRLLAWLAPLVLAACSAPDAPATQPPTATAPQWPTTPPLNDLERQLMGDPSPPLDTLPTAWSSPLPAHPEELVMRPPGPDSVPRPDAPAPLLVSTPVAALGPGGSPVLNAYEQAQLAEKNRRDEERRDRRFWDYQHRMQYRQDRLDEARADRARRAAEQRATAAPYTARPAAASSSLSRLFQFRRRRR